MPQGAGGGTVSNCTSALDRSEEPDGEASITVAFFSSLKVAMVVESRSHVSHSGKSHGGELAG